MIAMNHPPDLKKQIGDKLRDFRQRNGLSQRQLANRSGVHFVTIARIETGKQCPDLITAMALAKSLGIKIGDFENN